MLSAIIVLVVVSALIVTGLLLRSSRRSTDTEGDHPDAKSTALEARREFPPSGLLVPDEVLGSKDSTPAAIWDALEVAATPIAVEYRPVSEFELAKYRTVPVNAAAQQAIVNVVKALDPKSPTLYKVVLPKGAELVKAVGTSGYRGFSRTGGRTAHAVLRPVAAGGAIAVGWPVLAVAGTVMAVDMVAQREQRAHQRQIEAILGRQEERYYIDRITNQRTTDDLLSRAISLLLDGRDPQMEMALKSANDEFHRAQQFLEKFSGVIDGLVEDDDRIDYRRLEEALGGRTKDVASFVRELHLSQAAIAIRRKALVADAAAVALADPGNPYTALRKHLDAEVHELEQAGDAATALTEQLANAELKGPWHNRQKSIAERETQLRAQIAPPTFDDEAEVQYLATGSGEILQLLPAEKEPASPGSS
jgi:hypothetical protein